MGRLLQGVAWLRVRLRSPVDLVVTTTTTRPISLCVSSGASGCVDSACLFAGERAPEASFEIFVQVTDHVFTWRRGEPSGWVAKPLSTFFGHWDLRMIKVHRSTLGCRGYFSVLVLLVYSAQPLMRTTMGERASITVVRFSISVAPAFVSGDPRSHIFSEVCRCWSWLDRFVAGMFVRMGHFNFDLYLVARLGDTLLREPTRKGATDTPLHQPIEERSVSRT